VRTLRSSVAAILIALAAAVVIVAVAIVPFLTPAWVGFEQDRSQAKAWTGFTTDELRTATNAILADLVIGPPDFDVTIDGVPVLEPREQAHMRDVRTVFAGLYILAAISVVGLALASRRRDRAGTWRAVRGGAIGLSVAVVVLGVVGLVAFDQLFEVFHEIFFPAGSFLFDPRTDRLVQLFPFQFWQETATVVAVVIIALALAVAAVATRRARRPSAALDPAASVPDARVVAERGA
jgi:integral membrane protein (TIGR01906 family)